jgi:hypothetical protein
VEATDYAGETNIPLSYIDTRASDSNCQLDFTIGTVAPFLMSKSSTYRIDTWADANGSVVPALQARGQLTGEVLDIDGVGCSLSEFPSGVINATDGDPWCVNVAPPFSPRQALSYIAIPDVVVKFDGSCYNWSLGQGYTWCGTGPDPN